VCEVLKRTFALELENTDLSAEELEELISDALDGQLPVQEDAPIVVGIKEAELGAAERIGDDVGPDWVELNVIRLTGGAGVAVIAAERARQISVEGWTPLHDDAHTFSELAWAATCYAAPRPVLRTKDYKARDPWPWAPEWDKRGKHDRIKQLAIAGALIAAEIDRLKRLHERSATELGKSGEQNV
jgi:hypothetical protein